jgi:hypothetical protein
VTAPDQPGSVFFHVSSVRNRTSILTHGLDWTRMGAARGIAGSTVAEQQGVFLAPDEDTTDWFVRMNNTGGPVDVWEVRGVDPADLVTSGEGYDFLPRVIPPDRLRLVRQDVPPDDPFGT